MSDNGEFFNDIRSRDPFFAMQLIRAIPPCPAKYRGVIINSRDKFVPNMQLMVMGLAVLPERIVRLIGSMVVINHKGQEILLVEMDIATNDEESVLIVLEALTAAMEPYSHPRMAICNQFGPIPDAVAPAYTSMFTAFTPAAACKPETEWVH